MPTLSLHLRQARRSPTFRARGLDAVLGSAVRRPRTAPIFSRLRCPTGRDRAIGRVGSRTTSLPASARPWQRSIASSGTRSRRRGTLGAHSSISGPGTAVVSRCAAVPGTRLELVYPEGWGILSPLRLPIPPPGRCPQCSGGPASPQRVGRRSARGLMAGSRRARNRAADVATPPSAGAPPPATPHTSRAGSAS
jgi:hypothetical protein